MDRLVDGTQRRLPPLRAGRQPAGKALLGLLEDPRAPRVCVVTGRPGSGRSHLVAWLAAACTAPGAPERQHPDAALSLAGMTVDAAVWTLAARLGLHARTAGELARELRESARPRLLILWDLDRAEAPGSVTDALLRPLLEVPGLRLVVEGATEPLADAAVLDLDQPSWTDPARFAAWYDQRRGHSPFAAADLFPHPGAALLAARIPAGAPADPYAGVHGTWWAAVPGELRPAVAALAAAVRPLSLAEWSAVAGGAAVEAASRLLPPEGPGPEERWWLPAGPLREAVATGPVPAADPAALAHALTATVPLLPDGTPDLMRTDPALLGLALRQAVHAEAGHTVGPMLDDLELLVRADPLAVTAALAAYPGHRAAAAWAAAGPALVVEPDPAVRAPVLLARLPHDAAEGRRRPLEGAAGWVIHRAHWNTGSLWQVGALAQGPNAGYVVLLAEDGTLQAVEAATGQAYPIPAAHGPNPARSLLALADGTIAALDAEGRPHLLTGSLLPAPPPPADAVLTVLGPLDTAGDSLGRVHMQPTEPPLPVHTGPVTALGGTALDGAALEGAASLLLSGGADGCIRSWRPGSGQAPEQVDARECPVTGVAAGQDRYGPVLAAAWADGFVRIHRPDSGHTIGLRLGSPVRSVLVDGQGLVLVVMADGFVAILLGSPPPTA
ncbi:hypothetical protein ACWEQL_08545 [Kitasatospora sp. NPDC004240]